MATSDDAPAIDPIAALFRSSLHRKPMKRSKGKRAAIRPRSAKREADAVIRRDLTTTMLTEHPRCCRCGQSASCLHEPQKRSRNPKAWLDRALCVPTCDRCNEWAEREVAKATAEGWLIPSYTPHAEAVRICADWLRRFSSGGPQ